MPGRRQAPKHLADHFTAVADGAEERRPGLVEDGPADCMASIERIPKVLEIAGILGVGLRPEPSGRRSVLHGSLAGFKITSGRYQAGAASIPRLGTQVNGRSRAILS
jgi:hypothetical protein